MLVSFVNAVGQLAKAVNMRGTGGLMKVAVLADIHGNLPALQTVDAHIERWGPDMVVVAGDVVNRGPPRPLECLNYVLEKQRSDGWLFVRGNHEDYVIKQAQPDLPHSGPNFEIGRAAYWTYLRLNGNVTDLESMPFSVSFSASDRREVRTVHASMSGNRAGIYPETTDDDLRLLIAPPPALLCVGHTHRPLIRSLDQTLVVNVGSVGMPFDGDHRAAYAQLKWRDGGWQVTIVRLPYDQAQAERDFHETGFLDEAGDLVKIMLLEFRQARPLIHRWSRQYEESVLSGQISVAESVQRYLDSLNGDQ